MPATLAPLSASDATLRTIAAIWRRNQPEVLERLALLDDAVRAAFSNVLTAPVREQAAATAHKLAGSLGMFGFHDGTLLARELELVFESPEPDPEKLTRLTTHLRNALFPA